MAFRGIDLLMTISFVLVARASLTPTAGLARPRGALPVQGWPFGPCTFSSFNPRTIAVRSSAPVLSTASRPSPSELRYAFSVWSNPMVDRVIAKPLIFGRFTHRRLFRITRDDVHRSRYFRFHSGRAPIYSQARIARTSMVGRMPGPVKFGIGQPVRRVEDERFIRGQGGYTGDINLPGETYLCCVRSPHAAARIRDVVVAAASGAPGVLAALTASDYAADGLGSPAVDFLNIEGGAFPFPRGDNAQSARQQRACRPTGEACRRHRCAGRGRNTVGGARRRPNWSRSITSRCQR